MSLELAENYILEYSQNGLLSTPEGKDEALRTIFERCPDVERKIVTDMVDAAISLKVQEAKTKVEETITKYYPSLWPATEAALSVTATLKLADLENPVGLNFVSESSVGKSLILKWVAHNKNICYRTDHFTPKSFVSHAASIKEKERAKIHLLPRIKDKIFIVSDLAPMFRGRADDILDNTIRLIRVFDGEGWIGDTGIAGRQGIEEETLFAWLGATTPLEYRIWDIFSTLGTRWFFLHIPKDEKTPEERHQEQLQSITDKEKTAECKEVVAEFLDILYGDGKYNIPWRIQDDPAGVCIMIQKLADLVAVCRGLVRVSMNSYRDDVQLEHSTPSVEAPYRANKVLSSIARGHAIINGRRRLCDDDLVVIKDIVLSSMPDDRRLLLKALIDKKGSLDTNEVQGLLKSSHNKALVSMEALRAIGLVELIEESNPLPWRIELNEKFKWILGEEFRSINRSSI